MTHANLQTDANPGLNGKKIIKREHVEKYELNTQ